MIHANYIQDSLAVNEPILNSNRFGALIESDPVPFSFAAPGWYLVMGILVVVFLIVLFLRIKYLKKNAYRKKAITYLNTVVNFYGITSPHLIYEANILLKQIVLQSHVRVNVAKLQGSPWIQFLNEQCTDAIFIESDANFVEKNMYNPHVNISSDKMTSYLKRVEVWIKKHKN